MSLFGAVELKQLKNFGKLSYCLCEMKCPISDSQENVAKTQETWLIYYDVAGFVEELAFERF